ncbi:hypothetical protein BLL52_3983, partial [Rhodoferax antarcticus ANT.BR]
MAGRKPSTSTAGRKPLPADLVRCPQLLNGASGAGLALATTTTTTRRKPPTSTDGCKPLPVDLAL